MKIVLDFVLHRFDNNAIVVDSFYICIPSAVMSNDIILLFFVSLNDIRQLLVHPRKS